VSDAWIALAAALLGAVVGGVLTMCGTIVVGRRELTRRSRIEIYDVLLPTLFRSSQAPVQGQGIRLLSPPNWQTEATRDAVVRAGTLAGRSTAKRARHLIGTMHAHDDAAKAESADNDIAGDLARALFDEQHDEAVARAQELGVPPPDRAPLRFAEYSRRTDEAFAEVQAAVTEFSEWLAKKIR
jgi:hypothetical protein